MIRRTPLLVLAIALTLAACGTSDPAATTTPEASAPTPTEEPPATDAPAATSAVENEATDVETPAEPVASDAPTTDAPAATPVPEEPASEPGQIGGRAFASAVTPEAQFEGNPFPDLVVDDVGRGTEANIANILPSERPVLLWTWAPH